MTHVLGRGAVTGDAHFWGSSGGWANGPDNVALDSGIIEKTTYGWGAIADTRYTISTTYYTGVVGSSFTGGFWDGRDFWLCDNGSGTNSVYRLNWEFGKSDLTVNAGLLGLGSINPYDTSTDGDATNIYFTSFSTDQVIRFNRGTGAIVGTPLSLTTPKRLAYDGEKLWVSRGSVITRIDSFTVPTTVDVSGFTAAEYMVFDGRHLWVSDASTTTLTKIDPYPTTPTVVATYTLANRALGLTFCGTSVWAVSDTGNAVYRVNVLTGQQSTTSLSGLLSSPTIAAYDGYFVIVADASNHVKINPITGRPLRGASYSGGGTQFLTSISQGSIVAGNGTTVLRGDLPQSAVFQHLSRDNLISLGGRGTGNIVSVPGAACGVVAVNIGTTNLTQNLAANLQDSQMLHISGTLTGNVRIDPGTNSAGNSIFHIYHDVTLGGFTLTWGSVSSNINLGPSGTHTMVISNASTGATTIANQF